MSERMNDSSSLLFHCSRLLEPSSNYMWIHLWTLELLPGTRVWYPVKERGNTSSSSSYSFSSAVINFSSSQGQFTIEFPTVRLPPQILLNHWIISLSMWWRTFLYWGRRGGAKVGGGRGLPGHSTGSLSNIPEQEELLQLSLIRLWDGYSAEDLCTASYCSALHCM